MEAVAKTEEERDEDRNMRLLITGGAGFIGSHFVRYTLENHPGDEIVVLDKLTYAGNIDNLKDEMKEIEFIKGDICQREDVEKGIRNCDMAVNFAAETHVDRSIIEAGTFVLTDVYGTYVLLEASKKEAIERFVQISTDEVYGSIERGSFKEIDPLNPSNPYSASKAAADYLILSYWHTHKAPVVITRSTNNFGPRQHPEKLIPTLVINALEEKPLPLYGDGKNVRDWIYVLDNCRAIDLVARQGRPGEIYNVAGGNEKQNLEIARLVLQKLDRPQNLIHFISDRPGHDRRYSLDTAKTRKNLGWAPQHDFLESLEQTIEWYEENRSFWKSWIR